MAKTDIESVYDEPRTMRDVPKKGALPKFGTARPAEPGTLPRSVNPLDRVRDGDKVHVPNAKRFKVGCRNYNIPMPKPTKYIVAASEEQAVAHYQKEVGLDTELATVKKRDGRKEFEPERPDIVCYALAD